MIVQHSTEAGEPVTVYSGSPAETFELGENIGSDLAGGEVLLLTGGLGAGKTLLTKGILNALDFDVLVTSPSFVLMAEHAGPVPLFHLDLYRLSGAIEALESGLADERRGSGVTAIEWADRAAGALPDHLAVRIDGSGDEPRRVAVTAATTRYARYIDALEGRGT